MALDRIGELLATPASIPEARRPGRPAAGCGASRGSRTCGSPTRQPATRRSDGVDLTIEPGETVAHRGRDRRRQVDAREAGRPGYYDVTGGRGPGRRRDVRDLDLGAFRHQLGVVPQEPFLFAGTIRDNIAYGRPDATDAEVEAAARAVGAHDVIAAPARRLPARVGEQGRSLSSGQRQLLALARARLVDPAILLLDEATSNLDLATEARVDAAMGIVTAGPHDAGDRPPAPDRGPGRPHRGDGRGTDRRGGRPRATSSARAGPTPSCGPVTWARGPTTTGRPPAPEPSATPVARIVGTAARAVPASHGARPVLGRGHPRREGEHDAAQRSCPTSGRGRQEAGRRGARAGGRLPDVKLNIVVAGGPTAIGRCT